MAEKRSELDILQAWVDAADRHHLTDAHIQMARELGIDPANVDKLAAEALAKGISAPFHASIEGLFKAKFGNRRLPRIRPIRETIAVVKANVAESRGICIDGTGTSEPLIRRLLSVQFLVLLLAAGLGVYVYFYYIHENDAKKRVRAKEEVTKLALAVAKYKSLEGRICPNLAALTKNMAYMDGGTLAFDDPWGRPYRLDPRLAFVYSPGPDGKHKGNRNATWRDDVVAEVEAISLKLLEARIERIVATVDEAGQPASFDCILHLTFNKPALCLVDDLQLGPGISAEKEKRDYPKHQDGDAAKGKILRFYEGASATFRPGWSPFAEGTLAHLQRAADPKEILAVFPPGNDDAFREQVAIALAGSTEVPNPVFRGIDDSLGYDAAEEPVEVGPYVLTESADEPPAAAAPPAPAGTDEITLGTGEVTVPEAAELTGPAATTETPLAPAPPETPDKMGL